MPSPVRVLMRRPSLEVVSDKSDSDFGPAAYFHIVNRIVPEDQAVAFVTPETPARDAIALMKKYGFSQLPVVEGSSVLGLFSYRAFALECAAAAATNADMASLPVEEFLEHETPRYARLTDDFRGVVDALDINDCVLVSGQEDLAAIITPMDVLRYLHRVANAFVLLEEIELALRAVLRGSLAEPERIQECLTSALKGKYRDNNIPGRIEDLTFDDYLWIVRDSRTWPYVSNSFGGTRDRVRARLEPIRDLRNTVFHFKRELGLTDYERLSACRDWLLRCIRKIDARAGVGS
jgi:CBS domain-containing protein